MSTIMKGKVREGRVKRRLTCGFGGLVREQRFWRGEGEMRARWDEGRVGG